MVGKGRGDVWVGVCVWGRRRGGGTEKVYFRERGWMGASDSAMIHSYFLRSASPKNFQIYHHQPSTHPTDGDNYSQLFVFMF